MADLPKVDWRRIGSRLFEIFRNIFQSGGSVLLFKCEKWKNTCQNLKIQMHMCPIHTSNLLHFRPNRCSILIRRMMTADVNYRNNQLHSSLCWMWKEPYCVEKKLIIIAVCIETFLGSFLPCKLNSNAALQSIIDLRAAYCTYNNNIMQT